MLAHLDVRGVEAAAGLAHSAYETSDGGLEMDALLGASEAAVAAGLTREQLQRVLDLGVAAHIL